MKITDLDVTLFEWPNVPPAQYGAYSTSASKGVGSSQIGLVTIRTDEGLEGHSFLGTSFRSAELDVHSLLIALKPVLLGEDPLDRERLYQSLVGRLRSTTWRALGAIDVALWDIAGKAATLPLHKLLGSYRNSVRAYASSSTLGVKQAYLEQAVKVKEAGFTAYKIHPPANLSKTVEICKEVRSLLGDEFTIMIDPSWAFTYREAIYLGRVIEELNFYWYEDPLAEDDIHSYVKLRQKLRIPIMATEQPPGSVQSYTPWITMQATDYLRGDVAVKGGVTGVMKGAHLADAFRMNYEVHHGGNSLNNLANLHCIMAMRNCEFFEVLLPDGAQKFGILNDIEIDDLGNVSSYDAPGLGGDIDFDLIERNRICTLS